MEALKEQNDRQHLSKLMTLIAIKIEEKFSTMSKAFLFFDENQDMEITNPEFHHAIDKLRIKFTKADIDLVFNHLDVNKDGVISYKEFCEFTEEKRRNIDPFSA